MSHSLPSRHHGGCDLRWGYVITVEKQLAQLRSVGLDPLEAVGIDGRSLRADDFDTADPWIYYVCRRS